MLKDAADYKKKRSKQTKSAVEKKNWLEGGLKELKRASTEMKREIRRRATPNILGGVNRFRVARKAPATNPALPTPGFRRGRISMSCRGLHDAWYVIRDESLRY